MAQTLDAIDSKSLKHENPLRSQAIKHYLRSPKDQICDPDVWTNYDVKDITAATQIPVCYQFFEQLIDAIGFPENIARHKYDLQDTYELDLPSKLRQVLLAVLSTWSLF